MKREITYLKAKLTNQRFYIELLEKMNENTPDNLDTRKNTKYIGCSTRIEVRIVHK